MVVLVPTDDYSSEDRRKHLEMIQSAIGRMASSSATSKGWLLPVATASFGYSLVQRSILVGLLGCMGVVLFAILDAHYLRLERAFRELFKAVAAGSVSGYDMNPGRYTGVKGGSPSPECRWGKVVWSWSIAGFHGLLLAAGILVVGIASVRRLADFLIDFSQSLQCGVFG